MKTFIAAVLATLALHVYAQDKPEHKKELIENHRAIAAAHQAAAQCLASGKDEEICHEELKTSCKRLPVIGASCGMRKHQH